MKRLIPLAAICLSTLALAAPPTPGAVDEKRLLNADQEPQNWMAHGRTYDEQRFTP